ncbi:hypothetical protein NN561_008310 [Cricetulus griseus]
MQAHHDHVTPQHRSDDHGPIAITASFVWDRRVGAEIRKISKPSLSLLEGSRPAAPPGGPARSPGTPAESPGLPRPGARDARRARPRAPLSARSDRPFPRRLVPACHPNQTVPAARPARPPPPGADSTRSVSRPPHPRQGAPLEADRLTRAPLAHTHRVVLCFPPRPAPPPEPAAAWLAESSRGRRFPPPARGEPRGQDGEGGRGAQRWPAAGGECPQEALARAGATGRPRTLPASIPGPGSQPGAPEGAEASPTPSSAHTHALLPPPYGNLQPPKVTRRRFLGLAARPPPPGQRSCRGDLGGGADSSEPRAGEEGSSTSRILRFLPGRAGAGGAAPLPGPELRVAQRSRSDPDSAAKFSSGIPERAGAGSALGQTRCPGPGSEARGPESDRGVARPRAARRSRTPYLPSG